MGDLRICYSADVGIKVNIGSIKPDTAKPVRRKKSKCKCGHSRSEHRPDCKHLDRSRSPYETWQCKCEQFSEVKDS